MWPFNESSQPPSSANSIGRNARVDALRDELHAMTLHDATTLPPGPISPDTALPSSPESPSIQPSPQARTLAAIADIPEIHTAVLESGPRRRSAHSSGVSDARRFGLYLPSATASENNLALHRPGPFMLHGLHQRTTSLPLASSAAAAALEHGAPCRPQTSPHRYDDVTNHDPPPKYVAFDPYPFFGVEPRTRRRSTIQVIETVCKDGFKATTGKVGKSVVKHVEDVGKIAKDVPSALKGAQVKLSSKRAKGKLRWLEKRNYLSGQERLLTQALVG